MFLVIAFGAGWFFLRGLGGPAPPYLRVPLALPVGLSLWALIALACLLSPFGGSSLALGMYSLTAAGCVWIGVKGAALDRGERYGLVVGATVVLLAGLWVDRLGITGSDDANMLAIGMALAEAGTIVPFVQQQLMSFPLLLPMTQAAANLLDAEAVTRATPILTIGLVVLFVGALRQRFLPAGRLPASLAAGAMALVLFSSTQMFVQATYLNHHIVTALLVLGAWLYREEFLRTRNPGAIHAAAALIAFTVLTRLENPLVALILMVCLFNEDVPRRLRIQAVWLTVAVFLAVQAAIATLGSVDIGMSSIVSPKRTYLMMLLLAGYGTFASLPDHRHLTSLRVVAPRLVVAALVSAILLATAVVPQDMLRSERAMLVSLFAARGEWGLFWYGVAAGILLALVRRPSRSRLLQHPLFTAAVAMVLLTVALGALMPYRSAWSDSANRMMVHVAPLFLLTLTDAVLPPTGAAVAARR